MVVGAVARAKQWALVATAGVRAAEWFRPRAQPSVHSLLFHRFFTPGEAREAGLDRLRWQLEWLKSRYQPISLSRFINGLEHSSLPDRGILVTSDDALLDLLDVVDEFHRFEVPISAFVCAGWTAQASRGVDNDLVARAAATIQWYEGPHMQVHVGAHPFNLSAATRATNIDLLLRLREELLPHLASFCKYIEGRTSARTGFCTWNELRELKRAGLEIGAHSVTHVWMSGTSPIRRAFEIGESKRLCDELLGGCAAFAYPYGMAETHDSSTRAELVKAGYRVSFLTHSDFITVGADRYTLPRVLMPDCPLPPAEFHARASGAGIAWRRVAAMAGRGRGSSQRR